VQNGCGMKRTKIWIGYFSTAILDVQLRKQKSFNKMAAKSNGKHRVSK
jgi:hypothetical protein